MTLAWIGLATGILFAFPLGVITGLLWDDIRPSSPPPAGDS